MTSQIKQIKLCYCDRCGRSIIKENEDINLYHIDVLLSDKLHNKNKSMTNLDLCTKCTEELLEWWNKEK